MLAAAVEDVALADEDDPVDLAEPVELPLAVASTDFAELAADEMTDDAVAAAALPEEAPPEADTAARTDEH